jgi:hypothetical protein
MEDRLLPVVKLKEIGKLGRQCLLYSRLISKAQDERTSEWERLKFRLWLEERYIVKSVNLYKLTLEDIIELANGIQVKPEWETLPIWQAMLKGDYWKGAK